MLIIGYTDNFALEWYSEKGGLGICLIHYLIFQHISWHILGTLDVFVERMNKFINDTWD